MFQEVHNCPQLISLIKDIGFLPLLNNGIAGYSAEEIVDADCRYIALPEGGWDWQLWKWKGPIVRDGDVVYGKFFGGKAGFVSREWWPDFCNYRRSAYPLPPENSIDDVILQTLKANDSMITRDLRRACGLSEANMRSFFDCRVTRLQIACRMVTEDFVYPEDRHGRPFGWGWSLLTTPEKLYGVDACHCDRSPEESFKRIFSHLKDICPYAQDKAILKILK
jgi:hypothetical protein